ncbi:hypothetical protein SAMN05421839_1184 [Halolactibacillus halophilus]|uniref:Uncharacterized protein n=1 Tax=Halolactibacillus halophilus TaxID=306540 RepID=A0A1I5Q053_9BACI|nr:hypothetical protein [Halolactibacillus halophilus]GEM01927.1 hypothetical protein HHA03_14590 [Halolactibacillus halophilus]SFP39708.1 hypothetical protein SAMN05421839_1184 [Halolactibacillus halophilus]
MYVIKDEPRTLINGYIDFSTRKKLGQLVTDAYKWSSLLQENTLQLKTIRGKKRLLPEIKNVSIEFFLIQAMKNNELPFKYRFANNVRGSHPYLELYNDDTIIHVNQVSRKNMCARKAICRDVLFKPIQSYIEFEELDEISYHEKRYFQLNHGYQTSTPEFVTLGIPNNSYKFDASIPILEEYTAIEGHLPKSKIEKIDGDFLDAFQRYAEGDEQNEEGNVK